MSADAFSLLSEKFKSATSNREVLQMLERFMADLELLIPGAASWPMDELFRYLHAHPQTAAQLTQLTLVSPSVRIID